MNDGSTALECICVFTLESTIKRFGPLSSGAKGGEFLIALTAITLSSSGYGIR
jgi:hypothetical protein